MMAAVVLDQQEDEEEDEKGLKHMENCLLIALIMHTKSNYIIMMENATKTSMNHLI